MRENMMEARARNKNNVPFSQGGISRSSTLPVRIPFQRGISLCPTAGELIYGLKHANHGPSPGGP